MEKIYIYAHINKINGKIYIGQTNDPDKRWRNNGIEYKPRENSESYFYKAIQKYGWDNFEHKILQECNSREEANILEQQYIRKYNTLNPNFGYNLSSGGEARDWFKNASPERQKEYQEVRRQISKRLWKDEEYVKKQKEGMKKVKDTQEYKDKMSETVKKRYLDKSYKEKMHRKAQLNGQPFQCVETKEVFRCITEATAKVGGSPNSNSINFQLSGKYKTAYGYTWKRISLDEFYEWNDKGFYHGNLIE